MGTLTFDVVLLELLGLILEPLELTLDRVLVECTPSFELAVGSHCGCLNVMCVDGPDVVYVKLSLRV